MVDHTFLGLDVMGTTPERRIKPKIYQRGYLFLKKLAADLERERDNLILSPNSIMLDVGAGNSPYHGFFREKVKRVISLDRTILGKATVLGDAEKIPFKDRSMDFILCTQALEHIQNPWEAIREIYRVLNFGGTVFLSTHGIWEIHPSPKDYWRFNPDGFESMFRNYKDVRIIPNGGDFLCFFQLANLLVGKFFHGLLKLPVFAIWLINNILGIVADKYSGKGRLAINYLIVAKK